MASTKRDNCRRKRNYADGRKFRQKNHNLTVVYVQRHAIKIQKPVLKCTALLRNMVKHDTVSVVEIRDFSVSGYFYEAKNSCCGSDECRFYFVKYFAGVPKLAKTGMWVFLFYC